MRRLRGAALACVLSAFGLACENGGPIDDSADEGALTGDDATKEVPFYFTLPKALLPTTFEAPAPYRTYVQPAREAKLKDYAGLQMIAIDEGGTNDERVAIRRRMAKTLGEAGILRDGDVLVAVRAYQKDSVPYVHTQLGAQHTGLVFTHGGDDRAAYHVDEPLDLNHNRLDPPPPNDPNGAGGNQSRPRKFVSQWDGPAYIGSRDEPPIPMLHIIRPRFMDDARKVSMRKWIDRLGERWEALRRQQILAYNANFLDPVAPRIGGTQKSVTQLGKVLLGSEGPEKFTMYCSELSWHLLALSNCSESEITNASDDEGARCAGSLPFPMQPVAMDGDVWGLTDGPLATIDASIAAGANLGDDDKRTLLKLVFPAHEDTSHLTALHARMSEQLRPMIAMVKPYYEARLGLGGDVPAVARAANGALHGVRNYAPASFVVEAMRPDSVRNFDYVATIAFTKPGN